MVARTVGNRVSLPCFTGALGSMGHEHTISNGKLVRAMLNKVVKFDERHAVTVFG